jgi:hypothetical protein
MAQELQTTQQGGFLVHPEDALAQLKEMQAVIKEVMKNGEHYGTIPGTGKPTLLKPGAELLNNMYGYRLSDLQIVQQIEQWDIPVTDHSFPLFRYMTKATLTDKDGKVIATGVGECNSYESKYRYRSSARKCPQCGKEAIIKGKKEYGGGFICFAKKGGCGAKFKEDDAAITSQSEGKTPNDTIHDQINTLLKMSKKRSYIDATLSATRTSGMFTQDMEDFAGLADIEEATVIDEHPKEKSAGDIIKEMDAVKNIDGLITFWDTNKLAINSLPPKDRDSIITQKDLMKKAFDEAQQKAATKPQPQAPPSIGEKETKEYMEKINTAKTDNTLVMLEQMIGSDHSTGAITEEQFQTLKTSLWQKLESFTGKK